MHIHSGACRHFYEAGGDMVSWEYFPNPSKANQIHGKGNQEECWDANPADTPQTACFSTMPSHLSPSPMTHSVTHRTLLLRPSGDHQTLNYPWPLHGLSNHFFWSYRAITGALSTSRHSGHRAGPTTCLLSSDLLPWVTQTLKDKRTCAMRLVRIWAPIS